MTMIVKRISRKPQLSMTSILDITWMAALLVVMWFMLSKTTSEIFLQLSRSHIYLMAFIKFALLATLGELLAIRITKGDWSRPTGLFWRVLVWGLLGTIVALVFKVYGVGVASAIENGLLPSFGDNSVGTKFAFAFFTSSLMNLLFAPTFMALHRITDTYIDMGLGRLKNIIQLRVTQVLDDIDWTRFISFVILRTIPLFWIPAHTITFLLPEEYRVLVAAMLSIALGAILGFSKRSAKV